MTKASERSQTSAWATALATITGSVYLFFGTLFFATLALLVAWIPPRGNWTFRVARIWSRGVLLTSGVKVRARFDSPPGPDDQFVFMANHRSLFDIPALIATLPGQTRFLAKKSLFQIPIFGWAIRAGGFVTIDRKNLGSARDSFAQAVSRLRAGISILVFPEGTRSTREQLLNFQRGGFLLALKSGLPIVPVGILGSREVQSKTSFIIRPGTIWVHYGSPLDIGEHSVSAKNDLMTTVRAELLALIGDGTEPSRESDLGMPAAGAPQNGK
jgi:1-acyl-sn-glycerol-3-phosphate acyltransferase